jgi:hypothetical protein
MHWWEIIPGVLKQLSRSGSLVISPALPGQGGDAQRVKLKKEVIMSICKLHGTEGNLPA